ncbi:MAG: hypothetical protein QOI11_491, partial [Candidatus Eremiobacteraeota bacterium]|nr:hypothetical protein [Candidatus Eremiobacteraeota bacterium]
MKLLLSAALASLALGGFAPAAAQTSPPPAPSSSAPGASDAAATRRPVLLNGCSLTSAGTASATSATQLSTSGSVQHTFTA